MATWEWGPQAEVSKDIVEISKWTKSRVRMETWEQMASLRAFTLYPPLSSEISAVDSCFVCVPSLRRLYFLHAFSEHFLAFCYSLSPPFVVFRTLSLSHWFAYLWHPTHLWSSDNSFRTDCALHLSFSTRSLFISRWEWIDVLMRLFCGHKLSGSLREEKVWIQVNCLTEKDNWKPALKGMMVPAFNPSIQRAEADASLWIWW